MANILNHIQSWFLLVAKALLVILLSYIILTSFCSNGNRLEWIAIPYTVLLLIVVLGLRIHKFKIPGLMELETMPEKAFEDAELEKKPKRIQALSESEIQKFLAYHELEKLLKDYKFFWRQPMTGELPGEKCDQVRFSDAFSGRPLRYVDHLYQDVTDYLSKYGALLGEALRNKIQDLQVYAEELKTHQKAAEVLSAPVFSSSKYVSLMRAIITELNREIVQGSS